MLFGGQEIDFFSQKSIFSLKAYLEGYFAPAYLKFSLKQCILQFPGGFVDFLKILRNNIIQNQSNFWYRNAAVIPDSWSDTLHDLIDLPGLAPLTRSGCPRCTAVRAVPRHFCPGSRQREAMVHRLACSESQDLKIDEGMSYKHSTGHWGLSEVWNCIIKLSAEVFSSAKASPFFNQP